MYVYIYIEREICFLTTNKNVLLKLCGSRKYPYPPPPFTEGQWKFRARGGLRQKFPRGVGGSQKTPFPGGEEASKRRHTVDPKHEVVLTYIVL